MVPAPRELLAVYNTPFTGVVGVLPPGYLTTIYPLAPEAGAVKLSEILVFDTTVTTKPVGAPGVAQLAVAVKLPASAPISVGVRLLRLSPSISSVTAAMAIPLPSAADTPV